MWPFDRKEKRERAAAELTKLHELAETALKSGELEALKAVRSQLGRAAVDAPSDLTSAMSTWTLLGQLREEVERLTKDREQRVALDVLERLKPCPMCRGRDFLVSNPVWIDELVYDLHTRQSPKLRLAVCTGCGNTSLWVLEVDELRKSVLYQSVQAKTGDDGPFRS